MSSTYASLHYHFVFSTKLRARLIAPDCQARIYDYMGGTVRSLEGFPQAIGGTCDHVHMLVGLTTSHAVKNFMRELRKSTSGWIHDALGIREFAWQEGYAVFSVSATARANVKHYIARQAEHHRKHSFREELVTMLERAGVKYDPTYLD